VYQATLPEAKQTLRIPRNLEISFNILYGSFVVDKEDKHMLLIPLEYFDLRHVRAYGRGEFMETQKLLPVSKIDLSFYQVH
jgi:hypothetical protein